MLICIQKCQFIIIIIKIFFTGGFILHSSIRDQSLARRLHGVPDFKNVWQSVILLSRKTKKIKLYIYISVHTFEVTIFFFFLTFNTKAIFNQPFSPKIICFCSISDVEPYVIDDNDVKPNSE